MAPAIESGLRKGLSSDVRYFVHSRSLSTATERQTEVNYSTVLSVLQPENRRFALPYLEVGMWFDAQYPFGSVDLGSVRCMGTSVSGPLYGEFI